MKIFIGNLNIASQINDWKLGFESNGCSVLTAAPGNHSVIVDGAFDYNLEQGYKQNLIKSTTLDKIYNKTQKLIKGPRKDFLFKKILKECDVFFYIWNGIYSDFRDFEKIKESGKKIIVQFVGGDVRWEECMLQEFSKLGFAKIEYENFDRTINGLRKRLEYLRKAEKYADLIYSAPNQMGLALREYSVNLQQITLSTFDNNPFQRRNKPKVLHVPSNPFVKGTKYVRSVFQSLEKRGIQFEPIIPEGLLSYGDVIKLYQDCDILVGQLLVPGGGKQERELLACGKVVLSNMSADYESYVPNASPIIDVNIDSLETKLEEVINNYDFRVRTARLGREYVELYHQPKVISGNVLNDLDFGYKGIVYRPTFFRDEFIPESYDHVKTYNEWNRFVSNTTWYKEYISKGKRQGLEF